MPPRPAKKPRKPSELELAALRLAARSAYTLEPEPLTLAQLVCRPAFRPVGLSRLRQWCREEDWDGQRLRKTDSWHRKAEETLRVPRRREDWHLRSLQSLHDEALRLRCHPRVQPKSWESVAAFQLRVAQTLHDWHREDRAGRHEEQTQAAQTRVRPTVPEVSLGSLPDGALEEMSDEEVFEGAHHILRRRLQGPEEPEEVKEPVKPRLVRANG